jgi:hypothetical protein
LGLGSLIAVLAMHTSGSSTNAPRFAKMASFTDFFARQAAALEARPTPRPLDNPPAQPTSAPSTEERATASPSANPDSTAAPNGSVGNEFSADLKKRHLGQLTVHSYASYARVYEPMLKYGPVEENLTVPCGKHFIAIGLPPRAGKREPIWLAPGKWMQIPCGGSIEMTMNPRRVR